MSAKCITFGAGGQNYIDAGQRLMLQAHSLNIFNSLTKKYNIFSKRYTMAGAVQLCRNRTGNSYLGNGYAPKLILNNHQLPYFNKRFNLNFNC